MVRTLWAGSQVDSVETKSRWAKPISADRMLPVSLHIISQWYVLRKTVNSARFSACRSDLTLRAQPGLTVWSVKVGSSNRFVHPDKSRPVRDFPRVALLDSAREEIGENIFA